MDSKEITVTDARLLQALETPISHVMSNSITPQINKVANDLKIKTGRVTKYYQYLDKAEVQLDESNKKVVCRLLHSFGGSIIDLFTPLAEEGTFCDNIKEPCIIPRYALDCAVVPINSDEWLLLGYINKNELVGLNPAKQGNIKISSINDLNQFWIQFGRDGLDIRLPSKLTAEVGKLDENMKKVDYVESDTVYTKEEVDEKIKNAGGGDGVASDVLYKGLLEASEDYKETSYENKYFLFRGDCWTVNNNFESSAAITSESTTDFTVTGTFRTHQDLIGIYWNSEDIITHPYISYGKRTDYSNVVLKFDYNMVGCKDFSYSDLENHPVSLTIAGGNGETYYFNMFNFVEENHVTIPFNDLILTAGQQYLDAAGNTVTIGNNQTKKVDVSDIKFIMIVLIPESYDPNVDHPTEYHIMNNVDFTCEITNIDVTNGEICDEHMPLEPHKYRICEGYDDFYNLNPYRVCKEMRKLGYVEWCDLYIGASHFYEKSGTLDDIIDTRGFDHTRTEKMVLNPNVPLNKSFIAWLDCYSRELKANDCPNLVISVSMENLQCPPSWRQRTANGDYALTGWVPSTFFYSPCHEDVAPYMQSVSEACLDIVVANEMRPILQMGEAWWWWNESYKPTDDEGNPIDVENWQPPCFYDLATRNKYQNEFGKNIPEYTTPWGNNYDADMMFWLNKQLCEYSNSLREVVKAPKYSKGLYMALFFPPSVLDNDRVPPMMQDANFLKDAYNPSKLDVLQIEDYDWVTGNPLQPETKERDRSHHPKAYTIGQELGFTEDRLHYFGGFVQYPENAKEFWRLIKQSMDDAIAKGFKEVYVWAGSQVRRDHKILGYDKLELVQNLLK